MSHRTCQLPISQSARESLISSQDPPSGEVPSYLDDSRSESAVLQVHLYTLPLQHTLTCPILHSFCLLSLFTAHFFFLSHFVDLTILRCFPLHSSTTLEYVTNERPTKYFKPRAMNSPAVPFAEVWLVLLHLTPFILCTQSFTEVILRAGMRVCLLNRVYVGTPRVVLLNPRGFTSVIYGKNTGSSR